MGSRAACARRAETEGRKLNLIGFGFERRTPATETKEAGPAILDTARLRLRPPTAEDAVDYHRILSEFDVTRHTDIPDAPSFRQSRSFVIWMTKLYSRERGSAWMIEDLISHNTIGAIRINEINRQTAVGEVGYELHPSYWGRGLMSEALATIVGHAGEAFFLKRLEAWVLPGNPASERVLEKNGFELAGVIRQYNWCTGMFRDSRLFGLDLEVNAASRGAA